MKVSVITTLFNYRDYIKQCIKSFLKQNFPEAEMIIVDDASTDHPYDVIKKYESDNVKYIHLDKNKGYSNAKNIGIKAAQAEILVMLDADDMLTENSIKIRFDKINEGFDLVHGPVLDLRGEKKKASKLWRQWEMSSKNEKAYKFVHAQSVMLTRNIHSKIGLYDESLRCKSDREMWARIFYSGRFRIGTVREYVAIYRRHNRQMHQSKEKLRINNQLQKNVLKLIKRRKNGDFRGIELL